MVISFLCLGPSCPSATFASQYGGFVPREWQAAKCLFSKYKGWFDSSGGVLTRDQIRTCNWTILCLLNMYEVKRVGSDEISLLSMGAVIITRTTIIKSASNNSLLYYIILYWYCCNSCIYGVHIFFCYNIIGKKRTQERVYMRWKTGDDIRITKTGATLCKSKNVFVLRLSQ